MQGHVHRARDSQLRQLHRQLFPTDRCIFILPICHAALLGVVKNFWDLILGPRERGVGQDRQPWYLLSPRKRLLLRERHKELVATADLGRPLRWAANAGSDSSPVASDAGTFSMLCRCIRLRRCADCRPDTVRAVLALWT